MSNLHDCRKDIDSSPQILPARLKFAIFHVFSIAMILILLLFTLLGKIKYGKLFIALLEFLGRYYGTEILSSIINPDFFKVNGTSSGDVHVGISGARPTQKEPGQASLACRQPAPFLVGLASNHLKS